MQCLICIVGLVRNYKNLISFNFTSMNINVKLYLKSFYITFLLIQLKLNNLKCIRFYTYVNEKNIYHKQ